MISALAEALSSLASPWVLAACTAVVFAAYVLRGATGFGAGVVAIPLLALAMPLNVVIPVVTTMGILASLGQSIQEIRHVDWRALRGLALPSAIGLGFGLWLFASLDQALLLRVFAGFIIAYGLWSLLPRAPAAALPPRALAAAVGGAGGLVATLFGGMAGPFYAIYLKALNLDKRRFRASMSSVLLCLGLVRAGGYGGLGFFDRRAIAALALFAPVMVLAMLAGDRWHARLEQEKFERMVAVLLVMSGVALLLK
ncbi:MAG TPA: sulfite exporter TauE/SafE family protein [Burkholderiales bacterium]|nr:sulfite exporter TauE/SafE family protein [Burkholderiales bacterium]